MTVGYPARMLTDHPYAGRDVPRTVKFHAPEIVFGIGSLEEASHAARRLGAARPFLVTDDGLLAAGWVAELLGYLRERQVLGA